MKNVLIFKWNFCWLWDSNFIDRKDSSLFGHFTKSDQKYDKQLNSNS